MASNKFRAILGNKSFYSITLSVLVSFLFVFAFATSTTTITSSGITSTGSGEFVNLAIGTTTDVNYSVKVVSNQDILLDYPGDSNYSVINPDSGFNFEVYRDSDDQNTDQLTAGNGIYMMSRNPDTGALADFSMNYSSFNFDSNGNPDLIYGEFDNSLLQFNGSLGLGATTNGKFSGGEIGSVAVQDSPHKIALSLDGNYVYISGGSNGLQVVDVTVPTSPQVVGSYTTGLSNTTDIVTYGDYVLLGDFDNGRLVSINVVADPTNPTFGDAVLTSGGARNVTTFSTYAYVASMGGGVDIFDITDPSNISALVGNINTAGTAYDVDVSGDYLYVSNYNELKIYDINNATTPDVPVLVGTLSNLPTSGNMTVSGGFVYWASDATGVGVMIIDVTNPVSPSFVNSYPTPNAYLWDTSVFNNKLYVPMRSLDGLAIVDISVPSSPVQEKIISLPAESLSAVSDGTYVYVIEYSLGVLHIVDPNDEDPTSRNFYVQDNAMFGQGLTIGSDLHDSRYNFKLMNGRSYFGSDTNSRYSVLDTASGYYLTTKDSQSDYENNYAQLGMENGWAKMETQSREHWNRIQLSNSGLRYETEFYNAGLGGDYLGQKFTSNFSYPIAPSSYTGFEFDVSDTDQASLANSTLFDVRRNDLSAFSINSSSTGYFSKNLGIGTADPNSKLDVAGNIYGQGLIASSLSSSNLLNFDVTSPAEGDYAQTILNTYGLVSYWQMNGDWTDSKGNNDGTTYGTPSFGVAQYGANSGSFDGIDDRISVGTPRDLSPKAAITLEAWVKTGATPADSFYLVGRMSEVDPGKQSYEMEINSVGVARFFLNGDAMDDYVLLSSTAINDDVWHHVAMIWSKDGGTNNAKIYIDGVLDAQDTTAVTNLSQVATSTTIGDVSPEQCNGPCQPYSGLLDEVAIYNVALDASTILNHYNANVGTRAKLNVMNSLGNGVDFNVLGNVGIGTTTPLSRLTIQETVNADLSAYEQKYTTYNNVIADLTATNGTDAWAWGSKINVEVPITNSNDLGTTRTSIGGQDVITVDSGSGDIFQIRGGSFYASKTGTGNANYIIGLDGSGNNSSSTVDWIEGVNASATNYATDGVVSSAIETYGLMSNTQNFSLGTGITSIGSAYGIYSQMSSDVINTGSAEIYNSYGLYLAAPSMAGGGAIGNNYGLYIGDQTGATSTSYAIYSENGNNYFGGIGTSTFAGYIDVLGNTSATSTFAGNLDVLGTIHGTNIYPGDLIFSNAFKFYEDPKPIDGQLATGTQTLKLTNQNNDDIFTIDEFGNVAITGNLTQATTTEDSVISLGLTWILDQFKTIGVTIADGIVSAREFIADKITGKQICVEENGEQVCFDKSDFGILRDVVNERKGGQSATPPPSNQDPIVSCGDAVCSDTETCDSCSADCGACSGGGESSESVPACGNNICGASESCSVCSVDCGQCAVENPVVSDPIQEDLSTPIESGM